MSRAGSGSTRTGSSCGRPSRPIPAGRRSSIVRSRRTRRPPSASGSTSSRRFTSKPSATSRRFATGHRDQHRVGVAVTAVTRSHPMRSKPTTADRRGDRGRALRSRPGATCAWRAGRGRRPLPRSTSAAPDELDLSPRCVEPGWSRSRARLSHELGRRGQTRGCRELLPTSAALAVWPGVCGVLS